MYKLMELPADLDLAPFAAYLWREQIGHRILARDGLQELWLVNPEDAERVLEALEAWRRGELTDTRRTPAGLPLLQRGMIACWRWPVTLFLLIGSTLATLLIGFGDNTLWLQRLTFVDFLLRDGALYFESLPRMLAAGEYWRLFTPALLHFSLLHLVFNLLWTWELGRRIERHQPSWWLLLVVLVLALLSNLAQFLVTGPLFGGLSGVVFGLMAYTWLWDRLHPQQRFGLPPALMGFMVLWLVLGISGLFETLGFGAIANTAHLVGLLGGLVAALIAPLVLRRR